MKNIYKILIVLFVLNIPSLSQINNQLYIDQIDKNSINNYLQDVYKYSQYQNLKDNSLQNITSMQNNLAYSFQWGNNNQSNMNLDGINNTSFSVQLGNNNFYNLLLTGDKNYSYILQNGDGNNISQDLRGNELNYIIVQNGNSNLVDQVGTGSQAKPYEIHQSGSGLKLKIINGSVR